MVEFHTDFLRKNYKKICRTCINNSYPVPLYFEKMDIPPSYCLTEKQINRLYKNLNDDEKEHLIGLFNLREETLIKIEEGLSRKFSTVDEFMEWEMFRFVNKFPEFAFVYNP